MVETTQHSTPSDPRTDTGVVVAPTPAAIGIAVVQQDFPVGDIQGNAQRIITAAETAYKQGARVVVTPELALCGYASEDLLLRPEYSTQCAQALDGIRLALSRYADLAVVVGHPQGTDQRYESIRLTGRYNMATVLRNGSTVAQYAKQKLPNYQVFDEERYFTAGTQTCVFEHLGIRFGLLICEDAWHKQPALAARNAGAQLLLVINASPFHLNKARDRVQHMANTASSAGIPLLYAHMNGAQDELVFDGASFALHANGTLAMQAPAFQDALPTIHATPRHTSNNTNTNNSGTHTGNSTDITIQLTGTITTQPEPLEQLWRALVMATRDYVRKNGFRTVILGLSGGIDSAAVMAIALDALGADAIHAIMMPSAYTADISCTDAHDMAQRTAIRYSVIPIADTATDITTQTGSDNPPQTTRNRHSIFDSFTGALASLFAGSETSSGLAEENLQARIRGTLLMAASNKLGGLVLTTGNKSEIATGYCTLYGDMNGAYAPIKDVLKTQVYELSRWRNQHNPFNTVDKPIPERIITRAPSAELRPNQTDQDSLPDYAVLDGILTRWMEQEQSRMDIIAAGFKHEDVDLVLRLIRTSEYKRSQSAIGPRVSPRAFGRDWRYPLTNAFRSG